MPKLVYQYDENIVRIQEKVNDKDVEFHIQLLQEEPYLQHLRQIRKFFEENDVYTDALFYVYKNHEYGAIVRQDYYVDFVLALMKYGLLQKVEWQD